MQPAEARQFVKDILAHCRDAESHPASPFFPFTKESCNAIIAEIQKREEVKPRALMHAFNGVLEEADQLMESGKLEIITPEFSQKVLAEYTILRADDAEN